jgi:hypothetical protein
MIEDALSSSPIRFERRTLQHWLNHFQGIHESRSRPPEQRAAAESLLPYVKNRLGVVRTHIEYQTLSSRIEQSKGAIQSISKMLESAAAPVKLRKAINTLFDSLWLNGMRKNQKKKLQLIKVIEDKIAHHADMIQRDLQILGCENDTCLRLDPTSITDATELARKAEATANRDEASGPKNQSGPKHKVVRGRAGAPNSPSNLAFFEWIETTPEKDQNVYNFCIEADRRDIRLPRRDDLKDYESWREALAENSSEVKKWYRDAQRAARKHAKDNGQINSDCVQLEDLDCGKQ